MKSTKPISKKIRNLNGKIGEALYVHFGKLAFNHYPYVSPRSNLSQFLGEIRHETLDLRSRKGRKLALTLQVHKDHSPK